MPLPRGNGGLGVCIKRALRRVPGAFFVGGIMPKSAGERKSAELARLEAAARRMLARGLWRCPGCGAAHPKHRSTQGRVSYVSCKLCGRPGKIIFEA